MKLKDIARIANVSLSTASLALNNKPGVNKATREKVINTAKKYNYKVRSSNTVVKKSVLSQTTKTLYFIACVDSGIVSSNFKSLPFFTDLISQIEKSIQSKGYILRFISINLDELHLIDKFEDELKTSSGVILLGTNLNKDQVERFYDLQQSLIVIDTCFEDSNLNFVVMNNRRGAHEAGRFLIEKGHRDIGYVQSNVRCYNFDQRREKFVSTLKSDDITIQHKHIFSLPPTEVTSQQKLKDSLLALNGDLPTALFCECDYIAISVIKTLTDINIRVPEDISVIGFDNIWESQIIHPALTTVDVKKGKIASLAVNILINSIEKKDADKYKVFVDTTLVERQSTSTINNNVLHTSNME